MTDKKPVNVSPLVKSARWSLLILGYIYGVRRKHSLEQYEIKASVERRKFYQEKVRREQEINLKKTKSDIRNLYSIFNEKPPPEWED